MGHFLWMSISSFSNGIIYSSWVTSGLKRLQLEKSSCCVLLQVSLSLSYCIIDIDIDIYVNIDSTPVPTHLQQMINVFVKHLNHPSHPRTQLQSIPTKIPADTANETICAWLGAAAAGDHDTTQNLEALHTRYLKVRDADVILIMPCI